MIVPLRSVFRPRLLSVCGGLAALGFASSANAALVYALTDENDLISFNHTTPSIIIEGHAISGLGGQDLVGIDFRPADGLLYGVGNLGMIYTINPANGAATSVSQISVPLDGSRFGVDFNPVADRLRIVSNSNQNLRVNVATGAAIVDVPLNYASGADPNVTAAAYTNSFPGAGSTVLYTIDVRDGLDSLNIQNPPNNGTQVSQGPLGINASDLTGFDIGVDPANGATLALAAHQVTTAGISELYSINLGTGAATLIGTISGGDLIDGLAIPIPEPTALSLLGFGAAGLLSRRRKG